MFFYSFPFDKSCSVLFLSYKKYKCKKVSSVEKKGRWKSLFPMDHLEAFAPFAFFGANNVAGWCVPAWPGGVDMRFSPNILSIALHVLFVCFSYCVYFVFAPWLMTCAFPPIRPGSEVFRRSNKPTHNMKLIVNTKSRNGFNCPYKEIRPPLDRSGCLIRDSMLWSTVL